MVPLGALVRDERANAAVGWALAAVTALAGVERLLAGALLWGGFVLLVGAVVVLPTLLTGDWRLMVPWPLVLFAASAAVVRAAGLYRETMGYVAVATVALVVASELDVFTAVDMSRPFAVVFAVLTTMAVQGLWLVAQFYSDRWLGTAFVGSQTDVQWGFVQVTAVGLLLGGIFDWYFERVEHVGSRWRPTTRERSP